MLYPPSRSCQVGSASLERQVCSAALRERGATLYFQAVGLIARKRLERCRLQAHTDVEDGQLTATASNGSEASVVVAGDVGAVSWGANGGGERDRPGAVRLVSSKLKGPVGGYAGKQRVREPAESAGGRDGGGGQLSLRRARVGVEELEGAAAPGEGALGRVRAYCKAINRMHPRELPVTPLLQQTA